MLPFAAIHSNGEVPLCGLQQFIFSLSDKQTEPLDLADFYGTAAPLMTKGDDRLRIHQSYAALRGGFGTLLMFGRLLTAGICRLPGFRSQRNAIAAINKKIENPSSMMPSGIVSIKVSLFLRQHFSSHFYPRSLAEDAAVIRVTVGNAFDLLSQAEQPVEQSS